MSITIAPVDAFVETFRTDARISDGGLDGSGSSSATGLGSASAAAPVDLLEGTALSIHDSFGDSSSVTAASVVMPSAEQLAALGGHAAGEPVQSNAIVGKVLDDSLGGSAEHGPSIDSLIASLPTDHAGPSAMEALANAGTLHDMGMGHFGLNAAAALLGPEQFVMHVDAPQVHA
jgi:hypothetical protein